jgi:hypothetical protein
VSPQNPSDKISFPPQNEDNKLPDIIPSENQQKVELERQKEEERRHALMKHRNNLKAFINAQKKKKTDSSDPAIDIVAPNSNPFPIEATPVTKQSSSSTEKTSRPATPVLSNSSIPRPTSTIETRKEPEVQQNKSLKRTGFKDFVNSRKNDQKSTDKSPEAQIFVKAKDSRLIDNAVASQSSNNDSADSIEIEEAPSKQQPSPVNTPPRHIEIDEPSEAESSLEIEEMNEFDDDEEEASQSEDASETETVSESEDYTTEEDEPVTNNRPSNSDMVYTLNQDKRAAIDEIKEEQSNSNDDVMKYLLEHQLMAPLKQTLVPDKQQKLSVRIEYLRQYCEKRFGEDMFLKIYRFLRQAGENDDETEMHEKLLSLLGNDAEVYYPYVQKVHQLIFCEDIFYSH